MGRPSVGGAEADHRAGPAGQRLDGRSSDGAGRPGTLGGAGRGRPAADGASTDPSDAPQAPAAWSPQRRNSRAQVLAAGDPGAGEQQGHKLQARGRAKPERPPWPPGVGQRRAAPGHRGGWSRRSARAARPSACSRHPQAPERHRGRIAQRHRATPASRPSGPATRPGQAQVLDLARHRPGLGARVAERAAAPRRDHAGRRHPPDGRLRPATPQKCAGPGCSRPSRCRGRTASARRHAAASPPLLPPGVRRGRTGCGAAVDRVVGDAAAPGRAVGLPSRIAPAARRRATTVASAAGTTAALPAPRPR